MTPWLGKAGSETWENAKKFWETTARPTVDHWLEDVKRFARDGTEGTKAYINGTLDRIRDRDAKKIVENARDVLAPMIRDSSVDILKQVEKRSGAIGEGLLSGAQKKIEAIVDQSVRTTISETRTLLATESPVLERAVRVVEGADKVVANIKDTIERAQNLMPHLRKIAGVDNPDVAQKTMNSFRETTQKLKEMVEGGNRLLPKVNEFLKEWHAEKERERQFHWRVVLGSTAAGLLLATFAYAVYLKLGWKMTPVRAISLFWLGISVPIMVVDLWALGVMWKRAREEGLEGEMHKRIFAFENAPKFVVLIVLVAANLILNLWLQT
jgi:hypothetical protein